MTKEEKKRKNIYPVCIKVVKKSKLTLWSEKMGSQPSFSYFSLQAKILEILFLTLTDSVDCLMATDMNVRSLKKKEIGMLATHARKTCATAHSPLDQSFLLF